MNFKSKTKAVILGVAAMSFVFAGCTKYASDEDLQALERQRQAALSAEQRVQQLRSEKADLERQISQKESELREAQRVLNEVRR